MWSWLQAETISRRWHGGSACGWLGLCSGMPDKAPEDTRSTDRLILSTATSGRVDYARRSGVVPLMLEWDGIQ